MFLKETCIPIGKCIQNAVLQIHTCHSSWSLWIFMPNSSIAFWSMKCREFSVAMTFMSICKISKYTCEHCQSTSTCTKEEVVKMVYIQYTASACGFVHSINKWAFTIKCMKRNMLTWCPSVLHSLMRFSSLIDATLPVHARRILTFSEESCVFCGSDMLRWGIPSEGFPNTSSKKWQRMERWTWKRKIFCMICPFRQNGH